MTGWMIVALAAGGGALLGLGLALVLRRAVRKQRVSSGWDAWVKIARTLPWRDRFALYCSTATGRPVARSELSALAAQRSAAAHRYLAAVSGFAVWQWRGVGLMWLVFAVYFAFDGDWIFALIYAGFAPLAFATPQLLRWDCNRAARSAERNRRRVVE